MAGRIRDAVLVAHAACSLAVRVLVYLHAELAILLPVSTNQGTVS